MPVSRVCSRDGSTRRTKPDNGPHGLGKVLAVEPAGRGFFAAVGQKPGVLGRIAEQFVVNRQQQRRQFLFGTGFRGRCSSSQRARPRRSRVFGDHRLDLFQRRGVAIQRHGTEQTPIAAVGQPSFLGCKGMEGSPMVPRQPAPKAEGARALDCDRIGPIWQRQPRGRLGKSSEVAALAAGSVP